MRPVDTPRSPRDNTFVSDPVFPESGEPAVAASCNASRTAALDLDLSASRLVVIRPLNAHHLETIRQAAPGLDLVVADQQDPDRHKLALEADVVYGWLPNDLMPQLHNLRWLALTSAGVEAAVNRLPPNVLLTNSSGVFSVTMAEHALAMMLAFARGLPTMLEAQAQQTWQTKAERAELFGSTCAILGLGSIGREVAIRAKAFGMRVIGMRRSGGTPPPGVDELIHPDQLDALLAQADHLVNVLPNTPDTHRMLCDDKLALLKPTAYVYNLGRGATFDQAALTQRLSDGRLAGAGLDVFDPEPLPQDDPLWSLPNVIVSPHVSAHSPQLDERISQLFVHNFLRAARGEPLVNVVDRQAGY